MHNLKLALLPVLLTICSAGAYTSPHAFAPKSFGMGTDPECVGGVIHNGSEWLMNCGGTCGTCGVNNGQNGAGTFQFCGCIFDTVGPDSCCIPILQVPSNILSKIGSCDTCPNGSAANRCKNHSDSPQGQESYGDEGGAGCQPASGGSNPQGW